MVRHKMLIFAIRAFAIAFAFLSTGGLWAQTASRSEGPFSTYQRDLEAVADVTVADASSDLPVASASDTLPAVPVAFPAPRRDMLRDFAQHYWNGRYDDLLRAVQRVQALRGSIEPILESEGLPPNLIGVVLVESAGQPFALSPRGAYGLWQLMPATARRYGLAVSPALDERTDTPRATRAAAQYLKDLYARFGSWPLALAAYNAGEATVRTAVGGERIGSIWSSSATKELPAETQNYVPAVLAARHLFALHASVSVSGEEKNEAPLAAVAPARSAGLLLDSGRQMVPSSANENALNQEK